MDVPAGKRDRAAARAAEDQDRGAVLRQRRGIRVPAHAPGAGPRRRAGWRGTGPQAHARAGPGAVPAEAMAALADRAGPLRADPGPGEPRLHRGQARRENGWRHYLYPDMGRVGLSVSYVESSRRDAKT